MTPEQKLWQSVVLQAVVDATNPNPPKRSENERAKRDADAWMRGCGRDFQQVCMMAGLDPEFVSEAYREGRINRALLKNKDAALAGGE